MKNLPVNTELGWKKKANPFVKFTENTRKFFMFEDKRAGRRKLYSSLWAVVLGLVVASLLYYLINLQHGKVTPFTFVQKVIELTQKTEKIGQNFSLLLIFFGFAGLAVSVGFKSGLFNIGIAGQMTMPAIVLFTILIVARIPLDQVSGTFLAGMFVVFILMGAFVAGISGALKAYFNVHEVISTIFLNWIITYLSVWLFTKTNNTFPNADDWLGTVKGTNYLSISQELQSKFIYFGFALLVVLAVGITFLYAKTSLGYKIKMVGLNKTNAKYVGVNEKLMTMGVMSFSGALAGIAGFYYIVLYSKQIIGNSSPLSIGFESIAIALVALNNPIGVIATSVFYSALSNSAQGFPSEKQGIRIASDFFPIITGLIIFMAALAVMFYKFKPLESLWKQTVLLFHKEYWQNFVIYHKLNNKTKKAKALDKFIKLYFEQNGKKPNKDEITKWNAEYNQKHAEFLKQLEQNKAEKDLALYNLNKQFYADAKKMPATRTTAQFEASLLKDFNELYKNVSKNSPMYKRALELVKTRANALHRMAKVENAQKVRDFKQTYNKDKSTIISTYVDKTLDLLKSKNELTYSREYSLLRMKLQSSKAEYRHLESEYEAKVLELMKGMKGASLKDTMAIYDEISKLKFELLAQRETLGLNALYDLKNKRKAVKRSIKTVYKGVKDKIYNNFMTKHFGAPYRDIVLKHANILDETGGNI
ncbi:ABC transporter permease [Mycoplasma nasistruthionis]|uniref:ABC transporter permease n=1 Tax=Mycoplasma nasistruthionis TaxID=353852 RepID=A0A5B7XVH6_9MOLU|nr:ABC transporter permease [Mycoplasma nasistruthionis]QCZ36792.1 ABC transporter permease [Mycoplasma nasistruthionis]